MLRSLRANWVGLALLFALALCSMLSKCFRTSCAYKWKLLSLLPPNPPSDNVNLFFVATSLFQK